ncbi:ribonuclease P protein component [Gynurincola endophyticus]|uniref:ribonuclease P protein component n=1 Tax=Gynurincola endophyticus TaxID=2479004 RepID=UPI000F8D6045|nr:ribonuclease P protein component [Gynurincola endophyticus]
MPKQFTLNKKERLKKTKLIEHLFQSGKKITAFPLRMHYLFPEQADAPLQAAFSASKKNFKRSHERNLIKRKLREAYRLQKLPLQTEIAGKNQPLILFFVYNGKEKPPYELIAAKMQELLNKMLLIVQAHEADTPNT